MGSNRIVVLTALQLEARAVRRLLSGLKRQNLPTGTIVEEAALPGTGYRVCLVCTGPGNGQAAVIAERVINWADPAAVLFVGIAGGLKPDSALGDVVVATQIDDYRGGKDTAGGFKARPKAWTAGHGLVQVAQYVEATQRWAKLLPEGGRPVPTVHFKPIASGDVLKNTSDSPLAVLLDGTYNDAVAIEMEAAGVAEAAQQRRVEFLVVRGISDRSDGNKAASDGGGWQDRAAQHAAAFALGVIAELPDPTSAETADSSLGSSVAREAGAEPDWTMLTQAVDVSWRGDLQSPIGTEPAALELHLIPAEAGTRLPVTRLRTLWDELLQLGRTRGLFSQAGAVEGQPTADGAVAFARDVRGGNNGLAVLRGGQRSAWEALPKFNMHAIAIFDAKYIAARLSALLDVLLAVPAPLPGRVVPVAGIAPASLLARGDANATSHSGPISMGFGWDNDQSVRTDAVEWVSTGLLDITGGRVAEELAARLDQTLQARRR